MLHSLADADQASFNVVTAMLCRIHQSGRLDGTTADALLQVTNGLRVYRDAIREHIHRAVPYYPLGMPNMTNRSAPIALGMRPPCWTALAVWRLEGPGTVEIPCRPRELRSFIRPVPVSTFTRSR